MTATQTKTYFPKAAALDTLLDGRTLALSVFQSHYDRRYGLGFGGGGRKVRTLAYRVEVFADWETWGGEPLLDSGWLPTLAAARRWCEQIEER